MLPYSTKSKGLNLNTITVYAKDDETIIATVYIDGEIKVNGSQRIYAKELKILATLAENFSDFHATLKERK